MGSVRWALVVALVALALGMGLPGAWTAAEALSISSTCVTANCAFPTDQVTSDDNRNATDTTEAVGGTTVTFSTLPAGTQTRVITGTSTFSTFNSTTGVLTAVNIALTSQIDHELHINGAKATETVDCGPTVACSVTATVTGNAAGQTNMSLTSSLGDSVTALFALSATCSGSDTATGKNERTATAACSKDVNGANTTANATVNVTTAGALADYVNGANYTVTRSLTSITNDFTVTGGAGDSVTPSNNAVYQLSTWNNGNLTVTYDYLLHALSSFSSSSTSTTLNLNFNTILGPIQQGDGFGSLSTTFSLFNFLNAQPSGDRIGLDLTSVTPSGSGQFSTNLAPFANLLAGLSGNGFNATLDTTQVGTFNTTFVIHLHDSCDAANTSCLATGDLTLNLTGTVDEPLPPTVMLMGAGLLAFGGYYLRFGRVRLRTRS